jgi:thiamine biosynthesis protein ThiS
MVTVNNRDTVEWREGMTVQDVLDAMGYDYALITVTVDGKLVDQEDYAIQRVADRSAVSVFHLAHGG